jgi:hypothetical protein
VNRLSAEKDALAAHCTGLKSENQQLSGLVTALSDTLRQQQAHSKILLRLACSNAGSTKACSSSDGGSGSSLPKPPVTSTAQDDEPIISCSLPILTLGGGDAVHQQQGVGEQVLPGAGVAAERVQLRSRHQRVAEWLRHERHSAPGSEEWTAWQQCLPLEPMSSSSSSSLQLALEDAMAPVGPHAPASESQ